MENEKKPVLIMDVGISAPAWLLLPPPKLIAAPVPVKEKRIAYVMAGHLPYLKAFTELMLWNETTIKEVIGIPAERTGKPSATRSFMWDLHLLEQRRLTKQVSLGRDYSYSLNKTNMAVRRLLRFVKDRKMYYLWDRTQPQAAFDVQNNKKQ